MSLFTDIDALGHVEASGQRLRDQWDRAIREGDVESDDDESARTSTSLDVFQDFIAGFATSKPRELVYPPHGGDALHLWIERATNEQLLSATCYYPDAKVAGECVLALWARMEGQ